MGNDRRSDATARRETPLGSLSPLSRWRDQARYPTGPLGRLVGAGMALLDRERGLWALSLLDLRQDDRVLEIGFGPGVDLQRVAAVAVDGYVAGIDHSAEMVRQARRRNAAAIRAGRVAVRQGSIDEPLPYADATFTVVFSINAYQFWDDPTAALREIQRVLTPGGLAAIAVQPRTLGATAATARAVGDDIAARVAASGFTNVRTDIHPLRPVAVACVRGVIGVGPRVAPATGRHP